MRCRAMCAAVWLACGLTAGLARQAPVTPQAAPHHAPARHHRAHARQRRHAAQIPAPRPPTAPSTPQQTTAPVPNEAAEPPRDQLQPGLNVVPGNLQLHFPPVGDGYLPSSSSQTLDDSHAPKVPGVTLTVPLGAPSQGTPP